MQIIKKHLVFSVVALTIITIFSAGAILFYAPKITHADNPQSRPHVMAARFINPTTMWVIYTDTMLTTGNTSATNTSFYTLSTATSTYGVASSSHQIAIDANYSVSVLDHYGTHDKIRITAPNGIINPATDRLTVAADTDGTCSSAPADSGGDCNDNASSISFSFPPSQNVLISEVRYASASGDDASTNEFIELYNFSGGAVNLNNWRVRFISSTGTSYALIDNLGAGGNAATSIASNGYYLIAGPGYSPSGVGGSATSTAVINGNGIEADGTILLEQLSGGDYVVVDMIGCQGGGYYSWVYEGQYAVCPLAGQSLERKARYASTASTMTTGGTDASKGNGYDSNSNYYDFAARTTAQAQNHQSTIEALGTIMDDAPYIEHAPITSAITDQVATVFARMGDRETNADNLTAQLKYSTSTSPNYWATVTGNHLTNNIFKFEVPTSTFSYYLKLTDSGSNARCVASSNYQGVDCSASETNIKSAAWSVASIAAGSGQITGAVTSNGTALSGATVVVYGVGISKYTVSASNGTFSFSNLPAGTYKLTAYAPTYVDSVFDGILTGTANLAVAMYTSGGTQMFQGGDMTEFRVKFTMPSDNMMSAPTNINVGTPGAGQMYSPVMIGLNKEASTSTISTTSVLLKKYSSGAWSTVSGYSVVYQPTSSSVTIDNLSYQWGPDAKVVIYSATALDNNSQYMVELLPSIRDTSGNALQGARLGGGHSISFSTGMGFTSGQVTTANFGQSAQYMPPTVSGSTPSPGTRSVARNARLTVTFSEAMNSGSLSGNVLLYALDSSKAITGSAISASAGLDTATYRILTVTPASTLSASTWYRLILKGGISSANGISMSRPGETNNTMYQADFETSASSDTAAPTVLGTSLNMYKSTTNPNCTVSSSGCITNVPVALGGIDITFSKDMSPSTINYNNIVLLQGTSRVTATVSYDSLSRTARLIPGRLLDLNTNYTLTVYGTSTTQTTVADVYETFSSTPYTHALQNDHTTLFTTTNTADTGAPKVEYANADDFTLAITFSEPMNALALGANSSATSTSVLNPANYKLYIDAGPPPAAQTIYSKCGAGNGSACATLADETGLTFSYDGTTNTVTIRGFYFSIGGTNGFRIYVSNATDLTGNTISDSGGTTAGARNMAGGPINNSATTFGMMGPAGGMMGSSGGAGSASVVTGFGGHDAGMMGMKPIEVRPMNMMAGATSIYMVNLPISQALSATTGASTSSIVLTFPSGFDVSGAKSADPNNNYAHKDINGPGTGTIKLLSNTNGGTHNDDITGAAATKGGLADDGITVNTSARTVTVYLGSNSSVGLAANDFIHLEIDGIKNASMAQDTSTSGYTVTIKTKIGGTVKESLSSMPFFLQSAGKYVITGSITLPYAVTITSLPVYIGSPRTGPIKLNVSFSNSAVAYFSTTSSIPGLPSGDVNVFTDPMVTPTSTDLISDSGDPRPIYLGDSTTVTAQGGATACGASDSICYFTKNITYSLGTSKPQMTVKIKGDFSGSNAGNIDIFAGGPGGYAVKTVYMAWNYSVTATSTTFTLPGTGSYNIGMGPAMPRNSMMMGPPAMIAWMPPRSVDASVSGSVGAYVWTDPDSDGAGTDDGSVNNGTILFNISSASHAISGHVYGKSGTSEPIANAEVFASSPQGGFGNRATTQNDGSFSINVADGFYNVGAFMPGMPQGQMKSVEVRTSGETTSYYVDGVLQSGTLNVVLSMTKESYTISGKVTDTSNNVVTDASVFAYRTDGPGHAEALTDSSGKYILYAGNGTWRVSAFLPGYGRLTETTVIVSSADQNNINLAPDTTTYSWRTIEGVVYKDSNNTAANQYEAADTEYSGAFVRAVNNRTGYVNETSTMASGTYKLTVPDEAGLTDTYTIYSIIPGVGEATPLTNQSVDGANIGFSAAGPNPKVEPTSTVTVNIVDSSGNPYTLSKGVIDVYDTTVKFDSDAIITSATSTSMTLPGSGSGASTYKMDIDIPGIAWSDLTVTGADFSAANKTITVNNDETVTVQLPTLYTITTTVKDTSLTAVPNAFVSVYNSTTGVSFQSQTNSSGVLSLSLPATSTSYVVTPSKSGYVGSPSEVTVSANSTLTLTETAASHTVSGQVRIGTSGASNASVYAKRNGGGYAQADADANGNYSLLVSSGVWKIYAIADGYSEQAYASNPVDISASATSINITLATTKSGLAAPKAMPVTPSNGGTLYDATAGINLVMPPSALGVDTSSYQMQNKETSKVSSLPSASPLGGKAKEITAFNNSGQPITTLNDDMTMEITYTSAELTAASIDTIPELNELKSMYFDSTANNWVRIPTTIMALDSSGLPVEPNSTLSNVVSVVVKGVSDHLTVFGITGQGDDLIPSTPADPSATAGSEAINLSWSAVTTNTTGSTISDRAGYEIYRSTSSDGTYTQVNTSDVSGTTYSDRATAGKTFYYKITAADTNGNESAMSSIVSATATGGGGGGGSVGGTTSSAPSTPVVPETPVVTLPASVSTTMSSATGGSVAVSDNSAKVVIPVSALVAETAISITPTISYTAPSASIGTVVGSRAYEFKAKVDATEITTFNKDLTLTFKYTDDQVKGIKESSIKVYYWSAATSKWISAGGTVDAATNTVTALVNHFTLFTLIGDKTDFGAGDLVKLACDSANKDICAAVYYLGNDGKRYVFPNEKIYFTWYTDYLSVKTISAVELASYLIGGNVNYKPGSRMVKITSDPKTYAVAKGGALKWVKTEALAKTLYGDNWNKMIDDLSDAFFFAYKVSNDINAGTDFDKEAQKASASTINQDKGL